MRYAVWVVVLFLLYNPFVEAAVISGPSESTSADVRIETGPVLLAQATTDDDDNNIFKHLQIELMDLQELSEQVEARFVGEAFRLTLDEAVRMALLSNQDILITNFETLLADSDLLGAWGEFDPVLSASFNHRNSTTPRSPIQSFFLPSPDIEDKVNDYTLSLGGTTPWTSTQYSIDLSEQRDLGTFTGFNSIYAGDATITVTQPLLRGFGPSASLVQIRSAKKNQLISESQVELTVLTSVGEVIKAYWDLVGAIEQRTVRQESLANAMRVVRINEQRFEIGVAAALEILQAKAGAALRTSDLIVAATAILNTEYALKNLIGLYDEDLLSSRSIIPVERPDPAEVEWDVEGSLRNALRYRPDIRSAELQVEDARLRAKSARNGLLPQLDLSGSYGRNSLDLDFRNSIEKVRKRQGEIWSIGVTGSIPIGNRTARANHARAKQFIRQQEQRLQKTRQDAMLAVHIALHNLASNQILIESNKQARILQEANVAAEEKRLSLGVTTSQEVLEIQEDLTAARTQEVQAQIDFEKSRIDLKVAEGLLLRDMGIIYEEMDEEPIGFFRSLGHRPSGR